MESQITEQKYTAGQIITVGWQQFRKNWPAIIMLYLLIYIPFNVGVSFILTDEMIAAKGWYEAKDSYKIINIVEQLFGLIVTLSLANIIEASINGTPISMGAALYRAATRWMASIWTFILACVILFFLFLLLIAPGIIWSVYYSFFVFVVALRGESGLKALAYSKSLVKGQWLHVLLMTAMIYIMLSAIAGLLYFFTFSLPGNRIVGIISELFINLSSSLFMVMNIVFFLNLDYLKNKKPATETPVPETAAISEALPECEG